MLDQVRSHFKIIFFLQKGAYSVHFVSEFQKYGLFLRTELLNAIQKETLSPFHGVLTIRYTARDEYIALKLCIRPAGK